MNKILETIDGKWIKDNMKHHGARISTVARETGLEEDYIESFLHDERYIPNVTRAMFYFYFLSKQTTTPCKKK